MVGGRVAARASWSGRNPGWTEPSGARSSRRRRSSRQAGQLPGRGRPPQAGQPGRYAGAVQASQSGSRRVPEQICPTRRQLAQRAERRWQAGHQGRPVRRDVPHGPLSWQIEQIATGKGGQAEQSGPSAVRALTGRRRPQLTQASRLAGSATRQPGQSGLPCTFRVAGSRSAPQRAQGWALAFATQLRQTLSPPSGLCPERFVQAHHPVAARAGGAGDAGDASFVEPLDQPQERGDGGEVACPGEQGGVVLQRPGEALLVRGPGRHFPHRRRDQLGVDVGLEGGDPLTDQADRVTAVPVRATPAPRSPGTVPGRHAPQFATG